MSPDAFVVDASVLIAAVLPNEPFHADAKALMQRLMDVGVYLSLPTIAVAEVAAAIARGAGDERLALAVAAGYSVRPDLHRVAVDGALGDLAAEIAARQRIRGCDAVYVALAHREQAVLITLDSQQRERAPSSVTARTPAQALAEWFQS
jgi:predicted nucleic acid-binding protein